jgi:T4 RnlA family RNA ligase
LDDPRARIRRECRGLIFAPNGRILSRRYHKFFNINERTETRFENLDFSKPHVILEKLDGSMITPIWIGDVCRWGTKMGITDTAMEAEAFVAKHPVYTEFARVCHEEGYTPIFEWCSRKNRIVLDYPDDQLVLTAIRNTVDGTYLSHNAIGLARGPSTEIPVVEAYSVAMETDIEELIEIIRKTEDAEGIVIRFDDGHMIKIKSEWYLKLHRAKDAISTERGIIALWLGLGLDDVISFLPAEDQERINGFVAQWNDVLTLYISDLEVDIRNLMEQNITRKEFALEHAPSRFPLQKHITYKIWDMGWDKMEDCEHTGNLLADRIKDMVFDAAQKATGKEQNWQEFKKNFWKVPELYGVANDEA